MMKPEQALILDPPTELHFQAPFNEVTTTYLNITNPTEQQICFKIKTTAPKTYCVRPNYGLLTPKGTKKVSLMLQPLDFEQTEKSKHKFMVQSIFVKDGEVDQELLWRETPAENCMNSKLLCVFDPPPSETVVDGSGDSSVQHKEPTTMVVEDAEKVAPDSSGEQLTLEQLEEVKEQLNAQIMQLKQENSMLKEASLRLRMARSTPEETQAAATPAKPSQRPVQSVKQTKTPLQTYLISFIILLLGIYIGHNYL